MKYIKKLLLICSLFLFIPFIQINASSNVYVEDTYGSLNEEEISYLNSYAQQISEQYGFGVYARIISDANNSFYNNTDAYIEEYYENESLGYGDTQDGVLLLIGFTPSNEGTYQVYCPYENKYITLDGLDQLDEAAYNSLKGRDMYNAIYDYLETARELMNYYEEYGETYGSNYGGYQGETKQDTTGVKWGFTLGIPPIAGLLTVLGLRSKHKSKAKAVSANNYIPQGGVQLFNARDMFLYQTVSRMPIPRNDGPRGGGGVSPGGSHFSSSGGMHSSGGHF